MEVMSQDQSVLSNCENIQQGEKFAKDLGKVPSYKEGQVQDPDGNVMRYKQWIIVSEEQRQCVWLEETITVFSNGFFKNNYAIFNSGDLERCFLTRHSLFQDGEEDRIDRWTWEKSIDGHLAFAESLMGYSDALRDNFDSVDRLERYLRCMSQCVISS